MPKFSCADFTFPLLDRNKAFQLLRLLEFDHVDLGLFARSPRLSPRDLCASPAGYTTRLKEDLKSATLRVSDLFLQIGGNPSECAANDPSPSVRAQNREVFLRSIDLCTALDSRHLTGLPGVFHENTEPEKDFALTVEEASWRTVTCTNAGIQYAIEPHLGSICHDVASTVALLNAVGKLTLTLDYGHFIWNGDNSEDVHALLPFASHFHARGGAKGLLQTSVAENEIDFAGIVSRLADMHYSGFVALEYVWDEWGGCNRTDNISETIGLRKLLAEYFSAHS